MESVPGEAEEPELPESQSSRRMIPVIMLIVVLTAGMAFLLRRRAKRDRPALFEGAVVDTEDTTRQERRNGMVLVQVGDIQRRFGIPVNVTIGGGRRDDFVVKGARKRELWVHISDDRQVFRHRKGFMRKDRGDIFRNRSFSLSPGIPVSVSLESEWKERHRYLK
jgi:hypothetical protein